MNPRRIQDARVWSLGPYVLAALIFSVIVTASATQAAWTSNGAGRASALAYTMPNGAPPAGAASGSAVTIRWPAATLPNGTPVSGYLISRFDAATGASAVVGAGCSGVITTTTCTEQAVPAGTWVYTDTPVQLSWTGGRSPFSAAIVVP